MVATIARFDGPYRFLSNFWRAEVELDGRKYPSVEHAYQAAKTPDDVIVGQNSLRLRMASAASPADAKRFGRALPMRPDWDDVKTGVMLALLRQKFALDPLKRQLLATAPAELVEGNHWHDRFWGRCTCPRCGGGGENWLGRQLMQVRDELAAA